MMYLGTQLKQNSHVHLQFVSYKQLNLLNICCFVFCMLVPPVSMYHTPTLEIWAGQGTEVSVCVGGWVSGGGGGVTCTCANSQDNM